MEKKLYFPSPFPPRFFLHQSKVTQMFEHCDGLHKECHLQLFHPEYDCSHLNEKCPTLRCEPDLVPGWCHYLGEVVESLGYGT